VHTALLLLNAPKLFAWLGEPQSANGHLESLLKTVISFKNPDVSPFHGQAMPGGQPSPVTANGLYGGVKLASGSGCSRRSWLVR